jgi:hypothetical protein
MNPNQAVRASKSRGRTEYYTASYGEEMDMNARQTETGRTKHARVMSGLVMACAIAVATVHPAKAQESTQAPAVDPAALQSIEQAARDGQITDEIARRLEPQQLFELVREAQKHRQRGFSQNLEGILIPTIALGGTFLTIVLVVLIPLLFGYRRARRQQEIIMTMVEKGMPVPVHLVSPQFNRSDLRTGIILLCVGAGVSLALLSMAQNAWALGLVPLFIGIGYTSVGLIEKRRGSARQESARGADFGASVRSELDTSDDTNNG